MPDVEVSEPSLGKFAPIPLAIVYEAERLLDFNKPPTTVFARLEIGSAADFYGIDDGKYFRECFGVVASQCLFGHRERPAPSALDGFFEFYDGESPPGKFIVFPHCGANATVLNVLLIEHSGGGEWKVWRSRQDSNLQPPRSKRGALSVTLREQKWRKSEVLPPIRSWRTIRFQDGSGALVRLNFRVKWSEPPESHRVRAGLQPAASTTLAWLTL